MPVEQLIPQAKAVWTSLSIGRKITLLTVIGVTIAGFYLLMAWSGQPDYQTLFSRLSPEDAGVIVTKLKEQKIPYRITGNGDGIQVPDDRVHELRLNFAADGIPQGSGIGFEVFDNTKLGMTEFVQNVNYQRALQGELSRTISQFDEIEGARVHIVMPKKSLFLDDEKPGTASVVLRLRPGSELFPRHIRGIVHLVSSSISGLEPENVTIVDNHGKMLTEGIFPDEMAAVTTDQFQFQRQMESSMEKQIGSMLEEALGPNKAIVRVSCELDFVRHEKTEEMYIPENQVIRSEQLFKEETLDNGNPPIGVAGFRSNTIDGAIGIKETDTVTSEPDANSRFSKNEQTRNYEIGKVISRKIMPMGRLVRMTTAVLVDGSYEAVKGKKGKTDWKYLPRSSEEMTQFENIVKSTMNFSADRGDEVRIENIPFETSKMALNEEEILPLKPSFIERVKPYSGHIFMGIFVMMTFLFLVRPIIKWLTSAPIRDTDIIRQLPKTVGEIEQELQGGTASLPYRDQVHQLIAGDSQTSANVMKQWING